MKRLCQCFLDDWWMLDENGVNQKDGIVDRRTDIFGCCFINLLGRSSRRKMYVVVVLCVKGEKLYRLSNYEVVMSSWPFVLPKNCIDGLSCKRIVL